MPSEATHRAAPLALSALGGIRRAGKHDRHLPPMPLRDTREGFMTKLGPYEVHSFADDFPLMEGEEFADLVQDVKKNGLREPILLTHDGRTLVDGRNRYRACEAAGVDPVFERLGSHYTEPMILDLIASKNLARRQLNAGQRAFLGLRYLERYDAATKEREA